MPAFDPRPAGRFRGCYKPLFIKNFNCSRHYNIFRYFRHPAIAAPSILMSRMAFCVPPQSNNGACL